MVDITISQVTDGDITGSGIFDQLMRAVTAHLDDQYQKNRIKGTDYANVYLGSMQAVLQQSMQYVLQEQQVEKQIELTTQQIELTTQQTLTEAQNTNLVITQVSELIANGSKDRELKDEQIETANKQQILLDTEEQLKQYEYDNILPEQKNKLQEEIDLLQTQDSELIANGTKDRLAKDAQIAEIAANTSRQDALNTAQIAKIADEEALLEQRKFTEQAEILDTVNGNTVVGHIGEKKSLIEKQTAAFEVDSMVKAFKLIQDYWATAAINVGTDAPTAATAEDQNALIYALINKLNETENGGMSASIVVDTPYDGTGTSTKVTIVSDDDYS